MSAPAAPQSPLPETDVELFCPRCGYSLRGLTSDICPECGLTVDRSGAGVSRIPWEHRRRIGRMRAWWRTLVMGRPALAEEVMRPVRYRDARLFQVVTVLVASAPLLVLAALPVPGHVYQGAVAPIGAMSLTSGYLLDVGIPLLAGLTMHVVLPVAIVLLLVAMTGVPSYFFHPPHLTVVQQNRAIALSYYACAPIVLLLPAGVIAGALMAIEAVEPEFSRRYFFAWAFMVLAIGALPVAAMLLTWWGCLRVLRRATACSSARMAALAATLPVVWVLLAALILVGLPWLVGFALLVVWSFQ